MTVFLNSSVELARGRERSSEVGTCLNQIGFQRQRPPEVGDGRLQVTVFLRELAFVQRRRSIRGRGLTRGA